MERQVKILRSMRKTLSVEIKNGEILVRAPFFCSEEQINDFLQAKRSWITNKLLINKKVSPSEKFSDKEIKELKKQAKDIIEKRVEYFSKIIGVNYSKITIGAQKTLWGSCTSKGRLSFNFLLIKTPESVLDYIVIHELCHLIELNHSKRFWDLVKKYCTNYKEIILWLKIEGNNLLNKI